MCSYYVNANHDLHRLNAKFNITVEIGIAKFFVNFYVSCYT